MAEIRFSLFPEQRSCKIQHRTIAINRYFDGRFTPHRGSFACLIYRNALFYFEFQNCFDIQTIIIAKKKVLSIEL